MLQDPSTSLEDRLLLAAPTSRDGEITRSLMAAAGIECVVFQSVGELTAEIERGAGALLLAEQMFADQGMDRLIAALSQQQSWSDLPVIALIMGGIESDRASRVLNSLRNVMLLERPAPMRSILSAVQAALRARKRQYQIRDQIREIKDAQARFLAMAQEREELFRSEQSARLESDRAGRMKDEFLATLSHELRTPLNAILGWSQLLKRDEGDKELVREGLTVIERNTRIQVQLIEDLLDMSRIISGKMKLHVERVEANSIINAAIETVEAGAKAKGVRLQKVISEDFPILGDPARLQQIIWNLLSNSIKFTPAGGEVKLLTQRAGRHITIQVVDTGDGIEAKFLPHVFERFRQADASTTRSHGGLGLGLAIVKHLVELHGGTVAAASAGAGQGSTFTVSLPLAYIDGEEADSQPHEKPLAETTHDRKSSALRGIKILVVDDEPDARRLLARLLEASDARVFTADSADAGLSIVEAERPDLLLSDIGMPRVDGYEFLRRVRALGPDRGGEVLAIALTAFARSEDRTRALQAGFAQHVSKPVEPRELIASLVDLAKRAG